MIELTVHTSDGTQIIRSEEERPLADMIADLPDAPSHPCGGTGRCGKCAVYAAGDVFPVPDSMGRVLACQARVRGNAEIWLPKKKIMTRIETRTPEPVCSLEPEDGCYGAAIDIGTTTVVFRLVRLSDWKTLSTVACENPQRVVAADVIGRIENALDGHLILLSAIIRESLEKLEAEAFAQAGLPELHADIRVITGNTTMLYLLEGRSPEPLSHAPFEADCLYGLRSGRDVLPRCMSAFVGADITCAVLSSGMCEKNETSLLIDIGTNGEIALWHEGRLTCCATAAGPAFEGSGISCGVDSIPGAVDAVTIVNGSLNWTTIDGKPPVGICGSGLIDLIAALLDLELVDETGAMEEDLFLTDGVCLTRKDIRQVQLAKGAIAAGIATLLRSRGLEADNLSCLYIAGGFGSHLNLRSAARIGLIPEELVSCTKVIGNAALGGAEFILRNRHEKDRAEQLAKRAECLNLGGNRTFSDLFIENMMFE